VVLTEVLPGPSADGSSGIIELQTLKMKRGIMRIPDFCAALVLLAASFNGALAAAQTPATTPPAATPGQVAPAEAPALTDEEKADQISDQVGKLMVKCVNLLTAQDPLSLDYCKQQRDLADQYPPHQRLVDKMMAHDEYGIALAAFDHAKEALYEFDQEVALVPAAVKPGSAEWSTAYWHRAMIYKQLGAMDKADRDYRAAEENFRKPTFDTSDQAAAKKRRMILRQHAALLQKEGKADAAHRLLEEAAK
jgi:tetratricopeptide (TPR) repeat protein